MSQAKGLLSCIRSVDILIRSEAWIRKHLRIDVASLFDITCRFVCQREVSFIWEHNPTDDMTAQHLKSCSTRLFEI